jgi:urease accessory protein
VDPEGSAFRELRDPALGRSGRDGYLRLAFERREEKTVLVERRFRTPLQVLEPLALTDDGSVGVMLLNPTGGLLGGDHLESTIDLGPGCHVYITTPSATRVYRASGRPTVQETRIRVGAGAVLEWVPDHVIPHPGSSLDQTLSIDLAPGASAFVLDAFATGRVARGEAWSFASLVNRVLVRGHERLLYADRLRLGSERTLAGLGGANGRSYVATFGVFGNARSWDDLSRAFAEVLENHGDLDGGASVLGGGGCVARILAASAPAMTEACSALWTCARRHVLGLPALELRKS